MSQISVRDLTFYYDGSFDCIFDHASFSLDTNWKLGLIGRNGKGKTTLLRLLTGALSYQGTISSSVRFAYFPYALTDAQMQQQAADFAETLRPGCEQWRIICELEQLQEQADLLYRPFGMLSPGERTKILLAILFSGETDFLLIDEPTNHLDAEARAAVRAYLASKKGFILVSHDRDLLDACTDHVLVLNRKTISVQNGNFSVWWENKQRADRFAEAENEKHRREIRKLKQAARRASDWADRNERTKIGFDPVKEPDRMINTRSYIGAKTKKMQSRVRQIEKRIGRELEEQEGLLQDIDETAELKMNPLRHHRQLLIELRDCTLQYADAPEPVISGLNLQIRQGERIALHGANGCGKSTLLRLIMAQTGCFAPCDTLQASGLIETASGLKISAVPQETAGLRGAVFDFCEERQLDRSLFCTLLRQLDFSREQLFRPMETCSEGQKKKILLAAGLLTPAHLFLWDEPLNYIDVFSRMQIEQLLLKYQPTMLFVEHDVRFREQIATRTVML